MHKYNLKRNPNLSGSRFMAPHFGLVGGRPSSMDLRSQLPPVFDQGEEGSCGPNSADGLMCFFDPEIAQQGGFSRQQIYYCVRQLEGDIDEDGGVETKDLLAVLHDVGAAPEALWPYTPAGFKTPPPAEVLAAASKYKISSYSQLVSEEDFLDCLAQGFPFILGIEVFDTFEDNVGKNGIMRQPNLLTEQMIGGHDVLVVGYDTNFLENQDFKASGADHTGINNTALLVRNSWGAHWGINGHFWMPIDFASNSTTGGDAWTGRL